MTGDGEAYKQLTDLTPSETIPLLYVLGLKGAGEWTDYSNAEFDLSSISMR
jgi:hypothetical protein